MKRKSWGFSLIELMIVVAIIGIIVGVAIPGFQQYILRGKQAAAKAVLMDIAQKQPQYLVDRRSTYASSLTELGISVPDDVAALYAFSITVSSPSTGPTYEATATPISGEVETVWFKIDQTGLRQKGVGASPDPEQW